jgi:hypothetical protein
MLGVSTLKYEYTPDGKKKDKMKKNKTKTNTICVGHHYTQTNTNNVNKSSALLQTTGDKDEPNIVLWTSQHHTSEATGDLSCFIKHTLCFIF